MFPTIASTMRIFRVHEHTLTLATDVGTITDEVAHYICKANHLIIESNYDEDMLKNGRYPYPQNNALHPAQAI